MAEDGQLSVPTTMQETDLRSAKHSMRDTARYKRAALSPEEISAASNSIHEHLLGILDGTDQLMIYVSKPLEVDTHPLIEQLLSGKRKIVVPIIEKETKTLRLTYLTQTSDLIESTFGVPEPIGRERPVDPRAVKAVIVPMLGFDQRGHRLGYGAGYYDRFLSANPHLLKIGLAFSCLEAAEIPVDENDVSMDLIITEQGIIRCGSCRVTDKEDTWRNTLK
ncbi:5-formyltetrahydrofolate cyclo-ligase [Methanoregula sp.]|jgi:5-formyltetrahydrofolate cyclo-ligase|uniref:5-formyltetrahydrofolate cyclo-ligase n=1 Tax=Methanoregula sp. TaxID=2052170 RepID=UPI003C142DE9